MIDDAWVERVKNSLPEMPQVKRRRYLEEYGLNHKEVNIIPVSYTHLTRFEAKLLSRMIATTLGADKY